ncbi:hypothetical protein [Mycobacterium sp. 23]
MPGTSKVWFVTGSSRGFGAALVDACWPTVTAWWPPHADPKR